MSKTEKIILKEKLENLYRSFDLSMISPDPLEVVRSFKKPEDQEIAGIIAASLAYGRAELITAAAREVLKRMGDSPWTFVKHYNPKTDARRFDGFVYRWSRGQDISLLVMILQKALQSYGTLGSLFSSGHLPTAPHIGAALTYLIETLLSYITKNKLFQQHRRKTGIRYLLTSPKTGSACKRMNLYIRWMVRRDSLDLGLWKDISPSSLVMPIDTHVAKISRNLGLTQRTQADWKMAEEVTQSLKLFDPRDPVKYDFALCHWGMLNYRKR